MTFTFEVNWFLATVWLGALTFLWLVTTLFLSLSIRSLKRRTTETMMVMHDTILDMHQRMEAKTAKPKRKTTRKPAAKKAAPAPTAMPKAPAPAWETLKASPAESKPTLVNAPNLGASTDGFGNN